MLQATTKGHGVEEIAALWTCVTWLLIESSIEDQVTIARYFNTCDANLHVDVSFQAFISCSLGVQQVGFVMICYGVADALGSVTGGAAVKKLGRIPIFIFAALINLALIITFLLWRPDPTQPAIFFVIAALWGLADAVWQTQINGELHNIIISCIYSYHLSTNISCT